MKKILITGATGFIGKSLAKHYGRKYKVTGLSRKKSQKNPYIIIKTNYSINQLSKIISRYKPDIIIHAAGSASVNSSLINPNRDYINSVDLFHRLIEGIRLSSVKPLTFLLSSAAVYGSPKKYPIYENSDNIPLSPYGYHKAINEILAKEYSNCFQIPFVVLRIFSVFGPLQKRLLIWEVYNKFKHSKEVIIEGSGDETRDYIHINFLANTIEKLYPIKKNTNLYEIYNLASGEEIKVKIVVNKIKKYLSSTKKIIYGGNIRVGHPKYWRADITKIKSILTSYSPDPFNTSLKLLIDEWEKANN